MKGKELHTHVIGSNAPHPYTLEELKERLGNKKNYSVRLYQSEEEENYFWITFGHDGTRLETYEYDNLDDAEKDYRLITATVRDVLACERSP